MFGSGTTPKIAMLMNRKFIGSEIESDYYSIAQQRLENSCGIFD
jgi:DNA modification methylase